MRSPSWVVLVSLVMLGSSLSAGIGALGWSEGHAPSVSGTPSSPGSIANHPGPVAENQHAATCTDCVLENISLPSDPTSIAYDGINNNLYVGEDNASALGVINAATNTLTTSIPTGTPTMDVPAAVAVDTVTNELYVPNDAGSNVTVVNATTEKTVASVTVKPHPFSAVFDSANGYIYVGDQGVTTTWISVINGATRSLVTNINMGPAVSELAQGLAIDLSNGDLYAGNGQGNNITVVSLSTDKVIGSIPVGDYPGSVALDTSNNLLYAANTAGENVSVVDTTTNTPVKSIAINTSMLSVGPTAVAYDAATGCVYAPSGGGNWVSIINTHTNAVIGTVAIQGSPKAIAVDPTNGNVYVAYINPALTASYVSVLAVANCPSGSVLASVTVSPLLGEILLADGSSTETATPTCNPAPCPGAVSYAWSINNKSLAHLELVDREPYERRRGWDFGFRHGLRQRIA